MSRSSCPLWHSSSHPPDTTCNLGLVDVIHLVCGRPQVAPRSWWPSLASFVGDERENTPKFPHSSLSMFLIIEEWLMCSWDLGFYLFYSKIIVVNLMWAFWNDVFSRSGSMQGISCWANPGLCVWSGIQGGWQMRERVGFHMAGHCLSYSADLILHQLQLLLPSSSHPHSGQTASTEGVWTGLAAQDVRRSPHWAAGVDQAALGFFSGIWHYSLKTLP